MSNIDFTQIITPKAAIATSNERLLKVLAEHRWLRETEGVNVTEGARFQSDRTTRAELTSLLTNLELGTISGPVTWKALSGWEVLGQEQLRQVLWLLNAHVQACFASEQIVAELIDTQEVQSPEEIPQAFQLAYDGSRH